MADFIKLTIDGIEVEVPQGTTVLEAADKLNIKIPRLCFLKDINEIGACRMCIVDTGARTFQASCVLPAANGMVVKTNTPALRSARRTNLELLLSNHDKKCLSCVRSQNCELQKLCVELNVENGDRFAGEMGEYSVDRLSPSLERDNNKCILCRRCVSVCKQNQYVGVIGAVGRGFKTQIASAWDMSLNDTACVGCGQCIIHCPVGALRERSEIEAVWSALADPTKHVCVQTAPAVRAALGEEFGFPMGTDVTSQMVDALHRLGFDKVFDTDFGADETIVEEAAELIRRVKNGGVMPMTTSCCPSWVKFCETYYPAVKGLWRKPTVENNVETFANVPQIINKGAAWFRSMGTEKSPGTKVFAVGGKINNTGLLEIPMGTTLRKVIYDIGGDIPNGKKFKAVQTGGPSGGCIPESQLDIPIDYDSLTSIGSMMGSGGMIVMDEDNCMVDIARFYLDFTVDESCGKCTPCRVGTRRMLEILQRIVEGKGQEGDIEKLEELGEMIKNTSLCGLGQTAPNPVLSTIKHFRSEYEAHIRDKKCPAHHCQALKQYFILDNCRGCTACARACPVGCISGKVKELHTIDQSKCIKCGACMEKCRFGSIEIR